MTSIAVRVLGCIGLGGPTVFSLRGEGYQKAGEIGTMEWQEPATLCRGLRACWPGVRLGRAREPPEPLHQEVDEHAHLGRQIAPVRIDGEDAAAFRDAIVEYGHQPSRLDLGSGDEVG